MRIERNKYLNDLIIRMGNGAIKVVTGIRRCGKTYLVFNLFREHHRNIGVPICPFARRPRARQVP